MSYQLCPQCGFRLNMDENPKLCKACGSPLGADAAETPAATGTGLIEDVPAANTAGGVESIGAYGKAADAAWEDPLEKVRAEMEGAKLEVPAEILERHRQATARRHNMIGLAVVVGALILIVLFSLMW